MENDLDLTELPPSARRINVSVEVLDERLKNWADEVNRTQERTLKEIRNLADKYDNRIGGIEIDLARERLRIDYASADLERIKEHEKDWATRVEHDRLQTRLTELEKKKEHGDISWDARVSFLKSGWTWAVAGLIGIGALLGVLNQLGYL